MEGFQINIQPQLFIVYDDKTLLYHAKELVK